MGKGYALDTLETALPWKDVLPAARALKSAIQTSSEQTEGRVLVFSHLSHVYSDGASVYVTYLFPRYADHEQTLENWKNMKSAASQVITEFGGTISHQHGVGLDHASYLHREKGDLGMRLLRECCASLDPQGIMNPHKLLT